MLKNKYYFLILAFIFLVSLFFVGQAYFKNKKNFTKIQIGKQSFEVEIVSSKQDLAKGLGGIKEICENCGMLFIFSQKGEYSFWMKDMQFPLDIIWIENEKIVHMEKNVSQNDPRIFRPKILADKVLELRAGSIDKYGFVEGDEIFMKR